MTAYFEGFADALGGAETESVRTRLADANVDVLPFDLLDDRRFEILVYRLKCAQHGDKARVNLMQGVGEKGRDVVVYSTQGNVIEIVQCKNLKARITAPAVRQELVKLALHAFKQPSILKPGPVRYELWCPGGFTEPAAQVFDRWPQGWGGDVLASDFNDVVAEYKQLAALKWNEAGVFLESEFAKIVAPSKLDNIAAADRVRHNQAIYRSYFQTNTVAEMSEVTEALRTLLEEVGYRELSDKDAKYIVDRLKSFPAERRMALFSGYIMGLPPAFVAALDQGEFKRLAEHFSAVTKDLIKLILTTCSRLATEYVGKIREEIQPSHPSLMAVFHKLLLMGVSLRGLGMTHLGVRLVPDLELYGRKNLRERLAFHVIEIWDEYQLCLAGYDPQRHPFGSDEEFRNRIARNGMGGAKTREAFEAGLSAAIERHGNRLEVKFSDFMLLVPENILLINDTHGAFESEWLMGRVAETIKTLDKLRPS